MDYSKFKQAYSNLLEISKRITDVSYFHHDKGTKNFSSAETLVNQLSKFTKLHSHKNLSDEYHMNTINLFYKENRENIIKSLTTEYDWLSSEKVVLVYTYEKMELKLLLSSIYSLAKILKNESETTGNNEDNKKFPERFMLAIYSLMYYNTISNNEQGILAQKIIALQNILGIVDENEEKTYGIGSIFKMFMGGGMGEQIKNMFVGDNIGMIKEMSERMLGSTELIDKLEEKVKEHDGDIFSIGKDLMNDDDIGNISMDAMDKLGNLSGVSNVKKGIESMLDSFGMGSSEKEEAEVPTYLTLND